MTARHDRPLTDTTWAQIATQLIDAAGIAPYGDLDACRWIALRHARDHVHLVTTLVRQDGRIPEMHGYWYRMRDTCDRIEAELGLLLTCSSRT
ncbi:relaxase/mobilization nuclease domain-containing protein [Nonomuraea sp. LP-02]|uniref:relaxase/mobilization nuclease domain-containing protein n=1 Tax=Nonomuraea sp. LP-02 TaxID=3097960 RepID=UPI003FA5D383